MGQGGDGEVQAPLGTARRAVSGAAGVPGRLHPDGGAGEPHTAQEPGPALGWGGRELAVLGRAGWE